MPREDDPKRSWPGPVRDIPAVLLLVLAIAGTLVRFSVRDAWPSTALFFYATPPIVLVLLYAGAALLWFRRNRFRFAAVCVATVVVASAIWASSGYARSACDRNGDPIRLCVWNTARGRADWPELTTELARFDADIVALVEVGRTWPPDVWRRQFPGYDAFLPGDGIVLLARGLILEGRLHQLSHASRCAIAEVQLGPQRVRVVVVDLESHPSAARGPLIDGVLALIEDEPPLPTILVGDFNTPLDSIWFASVRASYRHAFEEAGSGLLVTWPAPLPLLTIDHVWVSETVRVVCAGARWTRLSDHLPVVTELQF